MEALAEDQDVHDNPPDHIRKIDVAEAFKLRFKNNLSYQAIADHFGCTKQSVHSALEPFNKLINNSMDTSIYDQNRAGILTSLEFEIVKQMSDKGKLKSASLNNLAYAISQINNMIRLEKGQPTSITESLDADLSGLLDRIAPLKSAGSGSTIDVSPTDKCVDIDTVVDNAVNQAIGLPSPPADRSMVGDLEASIPAVQPAKPRKARKPRTTKPTKSIKEGSNATSSADTTSGAAKEWYE